MYGERAMGLRLSFVVCATNYSVNFSSINSKRGEWIVEVIPQTSTQENLHTGYPCGCDAQKLGLNTIMSVPC